LNYTGRAVAEESTTDPAPAIQWQDLRALLFTGIDPSDNRADLGPAGIPTSQFEAWIQNHLTHIPQGEALWQSERRDLLHYDNFSIHQLEAILEIIQEGNLFGPWDPQRP